MQEFDFEAAAKHAKRLDKMIGLAVSTLKLSITNFKHLVSFVNGLSIDDIIEGFVGIVKNLPKHILSFRQIAKKLFLALDDYTSLPPVIFMVRDLVEKVSDLFNDVKHDVMTLYNVCICLYIFIYINTLFIQILYLVCVTAINVKLT